MLREINPAVVHADNPFGGSIFEILQQMNLLQVYQMEKLETDGMTYHKRCFKCEVCKKAVSLQGFAALEGKVGVRYSRLTCESRTSWLRFSASRISSSCLHLRVTTTRASEPSSTRISGTTMALAALKSNAYLYIRVIILDFNPLQPSNYMRSS